MTLSFTRSPTTTPGDFSFRLERPQSKLPASYFWTWDHSTNWVLDDPGNQTSGCYNRYFKQPETFIEDYRRLTDLCAGIGIAGIVIWGFLRDSHGGVEYSKRVASYAASKNVGIWPGFGTTWYGGAYYEGDSPYCLTTFLKQHPDAQMLDKDGKPVEYVGEFGASPGHPAYRDWLHNSLDWLFREFEIRGLNLENGDMLVDYHPHTQALRKQWPAEDPEPYFFQGLSYKQALDHLGPRLERNVVSYATYTGFNPGERVIQNTSMGKAPPAMLRLVPPRSVCQWTLTGMLRNNPLPLAAYLDDGAPAAAFDNPNWTIDLRPAATRNVGFVHQGSQWSHVGRPRCFISTIKEACLRAYRSGLEGVSIHGEMSARCIPNALNYLAFSHFTHWPEDTLRDFARKTLAQVLGSERDALDFVEVLSHWDARTLTDQHNKMSSPESRGLSTLVSRSNPTTLEGYQRYRFWSWLHAMARWNVDPHVNLLTGVDI